MARAGQPSNFSNEIKQAMLPRSIATTNKGAGDGSDEAAPPASPNNANNFNGKTKQPVAKKGAMPPQFAKKGAA